MNKERYEELELLLAEGKAKELLEKTKNSILENKKDPMIYYYSALANGMLKDYKSALEMIEIAIKKDKNKSDFFVVYAEILLNLEQEQSVQEVYKKAIGLNKENALAWFFYGKYLIEYKKKEFAGMKCIYHGIQLDPQHIGILVELGKYYMKFNFYKEAKQVFRQALIQEEYHREANYYYGNLLLKENMPGTALDYLKKAYVNNWNNTEIEKDFFKAYKRLHPKRGLFWEITLWMKNKFVKVFFVFFIIFLYIFTRKINAIILLSCLVLIYSFLGPIYFYKKFEKELK